MTDDLRAQLRQILGEYGLSQTALATQIGTDRHTVSRALASNGSVPPIWQKMLDALGLELVLREFVVNPRLEVLDGTLEARYDDGCLSVPGVYEPGVMRERAVRLHYQDAYGQPQVVEADDYLARVLQHEYEHLDGKLYLGKLPQSVKAKHRAHLADLQRQAKSYLKSLRAP